MTDKLPAEWLRTTIGNVSEKCTQRKPADDERFLYVDIGSIDRNRKIISEPQHLLGKSAPSRARKNISKGDVIVSLTRPNLNAVALVDKTFDSQIASTGFEVLKPLQIESRYLFSIVRSRAFIDSISGKVQGALYPAAKAADVCQFEIPLPPLAEQKQIATKLDELLAQVDTIKTRLDTIPTILKRFRQSVLAAAVSGKLTEEWRVKYSDVVVGDIVFEKWLKARRISFEKEQTRLMADGKIKRARKFREPLLPDLETAKVEYPSSWATVSVSQFAECLDQIRVPVKKEHRSSAKGLYPYFGANGEVDRVDEYLFDDDLVLVTEDETFYGRVKPIAYRFTGKCWVNNHAHVLRAPTSEANDFLCYALMYYNVIPWLSGTTGRAKLTQAALNSLPLGLPPEEEQVEIVHLVKEFFSFTDQIEQQVNSAQTRVNNLTQSILAKAFQGELTAEWREQNPDLVTGENSAEALLEKIRTERESLKPAKKTKRKMTA